MRAASSSPGRRFLAPEVVQTSAMDCGPAALKCLLEGFGIPVSYGRLREACQTDVDGTSIDTIEEIAGQLGLEVEQTILPLDHLVLAEAEALPALVVVRFANGLTHFVVVWRRHGPLLQLMDPASGRRWTSTKNFLQEVYVHELAISAAYWREWVGGNQFLSALNRRLANLRVPQPIICRLLEAANADSGWRTFAALDAATRIVDSLVRSDGLRKGAEAAHALEEFLARVTDNSNDGTGPIPKAFWSARPTPPDAAGNEQVLLRGAVLVRILGKRDFKGREPIPPEFRSPPTDAANREQAEHGAGIRSVEQPLSPELVAALSEARTHPAGELLKILRADGPLVPGALVGALLLAAGAVVLEALLLRGLFDLGRDLTPSGQRLGAMLAIISFGGFLLLLELPMAGMVMRLGRRLELRLRIAFLEKIPRLVDRYFQSRLSSDMAERSHMVQNLRMLPELGSRFLRVGFELLFTTIGIIWLDPASGPVAVLATLSAVGLPLLTNPMLTEGDLRVRTHVGGLTRFYLDALLGLVPIRTHGAERGVSAEQESLLVEWVRAGLNLQRTAVLVEALQALAGVGLAVWLLLSYLGRNADAGGVLLLVYWVLNLPFLAEELAFLVRQYPSQRSITLRLLEPLGAPEEPGPRGGAAAEQPRSTASIASRPRHKRAAASISFSKIGVRAAGHPILEEVNLSIEPGEHIAIVGPSGAGKSSLVGLLLGWHRPAGGELFVDGKPIEVQSLEELRRHTVWVDPTVHLWNRSLLENLCYGVDSKATEGIGRVIKQGDLISVLQKLPDGLQTRLGEGGGLVSGGEGQRVRFARGLLRAEPRLVILDEPFRGLAREQRTELMDRARDHWRRVTLLCITHDVGETRSFGRVLVIEHGRIVEDGSPLVLAANPNSRYAALLAAEQKVREQLWIGEAWRRHWLEGGRLSERTAGKEAAS